MSKLFNNRIEKLEDTSLESISGGDDLEDDVFGYSFCVMPVGAIGALGCSVAGFVCQNKASKYMRQGDKEKSKKYSQAAKYLEVSTITCSALAASGALAFGGLFIDAAIERHNRGF